jgi:hypothetical protein
MGEFTKLQAEKEDKKKSMLSRLSTDAEKLFSLVSAPSWRYQREPKLNSFMERLTSDKEVTKALNLVKHMTKKWRGKLCDKGVVNFLVNGYQATDICDRPSGFTIFMCHPSSDTISRSPKETQNAIKSVFGDGKIDDDTSRFYADNKFYIPNSPENFELQLHTCIDALEAFTCENGIASEGYVQMSNLIEENYSDYRSAFRSDPFLGIRMGYFLDRIFQRFLDKLVTYVHRSHPLRSAARELRGFQKDEVNRVFSNIGSGVFPNIPLPMSLTMGTIQPLPPLGNPPTFDDNKGMGGDQGTNRDVVPAWGIPQGKRFSDFFDSKNQHQTQNFKGWPNFPHHKNSKNKAMLCIKYQVTGKCRSGCTFAHIDSKMMDKETHDKISTRLQGIYKT